jgi:hypothetical protein
LQPARMFANTVVRFIALYITHLPSRPSCRQLFKVYALLPLTKPRLSISTCWIAVWLLLSHHRLNMHLRCYLSKSA